jgi:hypothetical protein
MSFCSPGSPAAASTATGIGDLDGDQSCRERYESSAGSDA